jgi:hypothetical protein
MASSIASVSSTLNTRIASVSSTMATSIANVRALVTGVNASAISILQTSVAANSSAIALLQTSVAANSSAITVNSTNIAANTSSIAVNASAIAVNTSSIAVVSALIPTSLTELGITDGTAGQVLQTDGNSVFTFVSAAAGGANIAAGTNIALTQNGVTVTETTTSATINVVGVASAGTSASLQSRINTVSATMATSIANHLRLSGGTLTGTLTLNADPTLDLQAATKQYVDNLTASGIHFHESVRVENPGALTVTYNNGTAGVGATLTNAGTQAALVIDGITMVVDDRVLIYEQADATQNGVYVVTNVGSASTNWVLTRSADTNTSGDADANSLDEGSYFFVEEGNTGAGESYICNTPGTITFGTTDITFVQFSSSISYTAGTGININTSRVISTSGVATAAQLATLSATMATSIANRTAAITSVNTRINSVSILAETKASAATSANLQTRINAVSVLAETKASAATSANLQTRINTLSATMATSINNSNSAIATLSATMATSINNRTAAITSVNNRVTTLSTTMATSINNRTLAITSVNTRINAVSVLTKTNKDAITSINAIAYASVATSATLETRINTVSILTKTNKDSITSINAIAYASVGTSAALETRIGIVSVLAETKVSKSGDTMTGDLTIQKTSSKILLGTGNNGGPHGLDFYDSDNTLAMGLYYRTGPDTITFEQGGANAKLTLDTSGNLNLAGTVCATFFYGDGSNLTGINAGASVGTSATLETRIAAVSATMATSIANVSSALGSRITTLSATMATSIANVSATLEARINAVSAAIPATEINNFYYTATTSQTTFSGADSEGNTLSYTPGLILVTLNGLVLDGVADYTATTGSSIVLSSPSTLNDELNVVAFEGVVPSGALPTTGGTITGNLTVNGTVTATAFSGDGSALTNLPSGVGTLQAWVNFNGTGTVSIRASGNVSSITDNDTGNYTVNFTTAMPDANYAPQVFVEDANSSNDTNALRYPADTMTTFAFEFRTQNGGTRLDTSMASVAVFR